MLISTVIFAYTINTIHHIMEIDETNEKNLESYKLTMDTYMNRKKIRFEYNFSFFIFNFNLNFYKFLI